MSVVFSITVIIVLFVLSCFFSATETALFSLSKIDKKRLKKKYPHLSKLVFISLEKPRRTLITLLIGNLLVNTLSASVATVFILKVWGVNRLGLGLAIYTVTLILFCEIIPKIVASQRNELLSVIGAIPLRFFRIIFWPLQYSTEMILKGVYKALKIEKKKEATEHVSEEELKTLVTIGEEEGVFDEQETQMIQKLFELGERPVKEIMVPRVDMKAIDIEDSEEEHIELMRSCHFSHFPVYQDSPDHILGVISVQDFLLSTERNLEKMITQPLFVPETKRIDELLTEFKSSTSQFCICVDEYGGTAGVVTQEDVLEEIFGEYYDEYAKVENPIRPFGTQAHLVEAKIAMADFCDFFDVDIEPEEATTLGGYILEQLGRVAKTGDVVETQDLKMKIQKVVRRRILTVIIWKDKKWN
jgi:putative hemolysin